MIYHILNGDALRMQFPKAIIGEQIVARECLVDGDVSGNNLEAFFEARAHFLAKAYGDPEIDYHEKVMPEFDKILQIPHGAEVNLWFEYDLFCQVNMWFVASLLVEKELNCFWVQPTASLQYGFGGMNTEALEKAFGEKKAVSPAEMHHFAHLWHCYRTRQLAEMQAIAAQLSPRFPQLAAAVQAHLDRFPGGNLLGRPERSLQAIMGELGADAFGPVFRAFNEREAIYGFGDLQVKRIYDKLKGLN